jgi:hypothetical protein
MKKLRVYYKSSLLSKMKYFDVHSPAEGRRMIEALNLTVGGIIRENELSPTGTYSIGLEEFDNESEEWYEWSHPELGYFVTDFELEELEA